MTRQPRLRRPPGVAPLIALGTALLLAACGGMPRPMAGLDRALAAAGPSRDPVLAGRWLACRYRCQASTGLTPSR